MLQMYTSYFYQIRNFDKNMIPFSTAAWDPKWYHADSYDKIRKFIDKRGVINGVRAEQLVPKFPGAEVMCKNQQCAKTHDWMCDFQWGYWEMLNRLDCVEELKRLEFDAMTLANRFKFEKEPIIMLMVHEGPSRPCAERPVLQKYFNIEEYNFS